MEIYIFSKNKNVLRKIGKIYKSKKYHFSSFPVDDLKKILKKVPLCELVYLDTENFKEDELDKLLKYIYKIKNLRFGIIDYDGKIINISTLFHHGIVDYVSPKEKKEGITGKRINEILQYNDCKPDDSYYDNIVLNNKFKVVKNGWDDIKQGSEYTFCFMYISIDKLSSLKRSYGHLFIDNLIDNFMAFVENEMAKIGGRVWKRDDNEDIIVFPYDGKKCDAIISCYKLIRDRLFVSIEHCNSPVILSYTILLHLGNMKYQPRGKTGTTISDSINYIFHASQLITQRGKFYITDTLFNHVHEGIKGLFVSIGNIEGRDMKRMKILKYGRNNKG